LFLIINAIKYLPFSSSNYFGLEISWDICFEIDVLSIKLGKLSLGDTTDVLFCLAIAHFLV